MTLQIKALNSREFEAACTDGCVNGLLRGREGQFVYVELGEEKEYITGFKDNPKTRYKYFKRCSLFFTTSIDDLRIGDFHKESLNEIDVIVYG